MTSRPDLQAPTVREGKSRPSAPDGTLLAGVELAGRYRILERLGEGGMGVVYRARDRSLDLDIALKVLHASIADDPQKLAFFRNEVRVARMVTHPNVCRLHDLVESTDGCFITMEYVGGESLAARLRRGRLPLGEALRLLREVAHGVAAAHAAGVIHRDLKPSNVLLAGEPPRAIVADFGIAGERRALATGPQDIAGTEGYMAPEQAAGGPIDARADVFALGVLACVLVTGVRPPVAVTHTLTGGSAAALPVADLTPHLRELPAALAALIERCLAVDPAARPADAGELARALDALVSTPPRSRHRWLVPAVLALVVAAAAGVIAARGARSSPAASTPRAAVADARWSVAALDARGLPAAERWLAPAVQRLLVHELVDAWDLDARAGEGGGISIAGALARDPGGALRLTLGADVIEAASARELAITAAARLVERHVPVARRAPSTAELRAAGTADPEAWRLWRRAQREGWMQRWERATALCDAARARDPRFPLATLERALINDNKDELAARQLVEAQQQMTGVPVRPLWPLAARAAVQLRAHDYAGAQRTLAEARALPLTPRERFYIEWRWAMALYYGGPIKVAAPLIEAVAERHPDDAGPPKLLAMLHLASEEPTAATLALRAATRAVELAPEDASARADLGQALVAVGRLDEARARAAELAAIDPDERRLASGRLFTLHLALDDPAAAEVDARRLLSGSPRQRASGISSLALLDLYWGRTAAGVRGLEEAADAFAALGMTVSAARTWMIAARHARLVGDAATARRLCARVAGSGTDYAAVAAIHERLAGGALDDARARASGLPAGSLDRIAAELAIASATADHAGVLDALERYERLATTTAYLPEAAAAFEATGRVDEALAMHERVTRAPHVHPLASVRAWARLGVLREQAGDVAGARAAYAAVLARWSRATQRMPEVDHARQRLRALR